MSNNWASSAKKKMLCMPDFGLHKVFSTMDSALNRVPGCPTIWPLYTHHVTLVLENATQWPWLVLDVDVFISQEIKPQYCYLFIKNSMSVLSTGKSC